MAYLVTGSHADAEDLLQDTLSDVHRKWDRVRASDHPTPTSARCSTTATSPGVAASGTASTRPTRPTSWRWTGGRATRRAPSASTTSCGTSWPPCPAHAHGPRAALLRGPRRRRDRPDARHRRLERACEREPRARRPAHEGVSR
ncbi:hypothetical protein [Janibacter melonis]|uniref:hypothetical protein n=1 Tax=Janibacter melonis TaxID=262209 RepID=UPI003557B2B6